MDMEFGIDTFGDVTVDADGNTLSHAAVVRNVVEEGVRADELGLDFFGVGEHHREDFAVSATDVVLAAVAARTERIHLGSAVTVLSSDDPVRVFQRYATLDAISSGRAEVILGRGSFVESFPLFGFDLADYQELFEEKLALFAELRKQEPVHWSGRLRPSIDGLSVYPPVEHGRLRTWIAVGGSPESVVRAAHYGLPLVLAIIGGEHGRFAPFADLYRRALEQFEQPAQPIAVHSPGYIADTDEEAAEEFWPHFSAMSNRIGAERGWGRMTPSHYAGEVEHGALVVGSPDTAAAKIASAMRVLEAQRFQLKVASGTLPHEKILRSIELYATEVVPRVRELLG